jgi:chlorite dismutase
MAKPGTGHGQGHAGGGQGPEVPRQYVNFAFCRVDQAWRRLPQREREAGKKEFKAVVEEYATEMLILPYTLVGVRADADLMLWRIAFDLDLLQRMATKLLTTGLGTYLTPAYSYLAMTKRSIYVDKLDPDHPADRTRIVGDFLDLVMEMRGTEASRFTLRDTPTFTCLARSLDEALDSLG